MKALKETLFALIGADAAGPVPDAADLAEKELSRFVKTQRKNGLTVMGTLPGEADYTVMIDAHIDQIAMIVTDVDEEGFLTVATAGGIDLRALPSRPVTVHGREKIPAVFCSTPPHLASKEKQYEKAEEIKLDTGLGQKAKETVSVGDIVTFSAKPICLSGNRVSGRSLDDRAGVACLLSLAERLSAKKLPVSVCFVLSDGEEIGLRGIRPAAFTVAPDEAIAVDVTFGDGPGISEEDCGKLGEGPMIGVSPSLDAGLSEKLIQTAKTARIPYQVEVMGRSTGTNADMIGVSGKGVKTCTLSVPLRNMHTDTEVIDMEDLENTVRLLEEYILAGGLYGA